MGHQVNMDEARLPIRENTIISFTDDEAKRLIHPHTDALVVTLNISNEKVSRILIDTGSSVDILSTSAFHKMNVRGATTRPITMQLYGFAGERVNVKEAIQLQVTFGQCPSQITQMVDFLLVDQLSAHNAILGRPTLNAIRAIISTYHLGMKFPVGDLVGEVWGHQAKSQ